MLASIELNNVHIDLPVYTSRSRGLINEVFRFAPKERARVEAAGLFTYQVHALRGVTLSAEDGERIGLIGPNGAGKTTLLKVLSGAFEPAIGQVAISGQIGSLTDLTLGMDMEANGYDNIKMRGLALRKSRAQISDLVADVEAFCELGSHLALPVRTYSAGMQLRLAFAMSTAAVPDILLMDEVVGAGDAKFQDKAKARLDGMISNVRILFIASHSEDIIKRFCSRAIYLKGGLIQFDGSVDDCLQAYYSDQGPGIT